MDKSVDWIIHLVANGVVCEVCGKTENSFIPGFCNAHTHGMEKYGHLDFQMVLRCQDAEITYILNSLGRAVQNGARFSDGQYVTGIFEDCAIQLKEFKECDRTVLRVIIPDKNNRFPDEFGCQLPYALQLMETDAFMLFSEHDHTEDNDHG